MLANSSQQDRQPRLAAAAKSNPQTAAATADTERVAKAGAAVETASLEATRCDLHAHTLGATPTQSNCHRAAARESSVGLYSARPALSAAISRIRQRVENQTGAPSERCPSSKQELQMNSEMESLRVTGEWERYCRGSLAAHGVPGPSVFDVLPNNLYFYAQGSFSLVLKDLQAVPCSLQSVFPALSFPHSPHPECNQCVQSHPQCVQSLTVRPAHFTRYRCLVTKWCSK